MTKHAQTLEILTRCLGKHGVHADSTRYRFQCWTRYFALAIQPVLHMIPGGTDTAAKHLISLAERQASNGKIPILFLDGFKGHVEFIKDKVTKSLKSRHLSFMLSRYLTGNLDNITPGTRDSEIMFIYAVLTHVACGGSQHVVERLMPNVFEALRYIQLHLTDYNTGLLLGCDWRDTMHKELGDKALLTNNAIFYYINKTLDVKDRNTKYFTLEADHIRAQLVARWKDGVLLDYIGASRFDPLGGALSVLHDVSAPEQYADVLRCFKSVDSAHGVTIRCKHNPQSEEEAAVIERTNGVVVWPFVVGHVIEACVKMGSPEALIFAKEQLAKYQALDGFREYYDPVSGLGYGALEQLWSATLFLRAEKALEKLITYRN